MRAKAAAVIALVVGVGAARSARADNPWDADQRGLAARAVRLATHPEGVLPLLDLWDSRQWASPEVTAQQLADLAREGRLSPTRRARAKLLLARARLRQGDLHAHARLVREAGFVTRVRVVGPFADAQDEGLERAYPPETEPFDAQAQWDGADGKVGWRAYPRVGGAYVSFADVMRPAEDGCAYAQAVVRTGEARPLTVWIGAAGAMRAWWNGEPILEDVQRWRAADPDRRVASVGASAGDNRLLVKVCAGSGDWGAYLRVAGPEGAPAEGVELLDLPTQERAQGHGIAPDALPDPPTPELEALEAAAEREDADALESLARYLHFTRSDPARARKLALRVADHAPAVDRLLLAAELGRTRADRMRWAARARHRAPRDGRVALLRARLVEQGPHPAAAMDIAGELRRRDRAGIAAAVLRARVLGRGLGLDRTALAEIEPALARARSAELLSLRAELLRRSGQSDATVEAHAEHLAADFTSFDSRHRIVQDAVARGDAKAALEHLQVVPVLWPTHVRRLRWAARMHAALGRDDEAVRLYRWAARIAPRDPVTHLALGKLLLAHGRTELAAEPLEAARALVPRNGEIRDLASRTDTRARPSTRWVADAETLLARRAQSGAARASYTVLQDLTVVTLDEAGAASRFRQLAVQLHDAEAAQRWRSHSIPWDPSSQRVELELARIHRAGGGAQTSTRLVREAPEPSGARIGGGLGHVRIEPPEPTPGDVVELRWRVTDMAARGPAGDAWGDLVQVQRRAPVERFEHVTLAPEATSLYARTPDLPDVRREQRAEDGRRLVRVVARDVPAADPSPYGPPGIESAAWMHVATGHSWSSLAKRYAEGIAPRLVADAYLRGVAAAQTAGAGDLRSRVQRLREWVIAHIRPDARELARDPDPAPLVARRGRGGPLDAAAVFAALLAEAGVDARIGLARSRSRGGLDAAPASLDPFDHPLVWIPEADAWVDPVARHHGTWTLPADMQGATVLLADPADGGLRTTPRAPADRERLERTVEVRLGEDGAAKVRVTERARGQAAARIRRLIDASRPADPDETRARVQRYAREHFDDLTVSSHSAEGVSDLEDAVVLRYEGTQPPAPDDETLRIETSTYATGLLGPWMPEADRTQPLDLGTAGTWIEERTVRLPRNRTLGSLPTSGKVPSPFGTAEVRVERRGDSVVVRTELVLEQPRVSAERASGFRAWAAPSRELLRAPLQLPHSP